MKTPVKISLAFAVVQLFASPLFAETYHFDGAKSNIGFRVRQFLGSTNGKFERFSGTIELDREHPERSTVEVKIQVATIDTGIDKRDDHLRSEEFFNVSRYPQITFKSKSVKRTGTNTADVAGDLAMHGATKPITLHVKLVSSPTAERTRWEVKTDPIKRKDYNLAFSAGSEAISGISQDVNVNIQIDASRAQ